MVTRFTEGIAPTFLGYLRNTIGSASTQLVREVLDALGVGYTDEQERARFQEEIRRQARRDATAATDAVRTKLRRDLIAAANPKQKARTRPPAAD